MRRGGHPRVFNDEEVEFIRVRNGTMRNRELHAAFVERFGRTDVTEKQVENRRRSKYQRRSKWPPPRPPANVGSRSYIHDGCLEVATDTPRRYTQMQRVVWEEIVGPIPPGSYLVPINGDKFDFDPLNWLMLTNAMMNRLRQTAFFSAPPELRQTIFATAKLKQILSDQKRRAR